MARNIRLGIRNHATQLHFGKNIVAKSFPHSTAIPHFPNAPITNPFKPFVLARSEEA